METLNISTLESRSWFYYNPYTNVEDFSKAIGINMTVIFRERYGTIKH